MSVGWWNDSGERMADSVRSHEVAEIHLPHAFVPAREVGLLAKGAPLHEALGHGGRPWRAGARAGFVLLRFDG